MKKVRGGGEGENFVELAGKTVFIFSSFSVSLFSMFP
jgi:hypothetical protein